MGIPLPTRGKTTWRLVKLRRQEKEPSPKKADPQEAKSPSGFADDMAVLDRADVQSDVVMSI